MKSLILLSLAGCMWRTPALLPPQTHDPRDVDATTDATTGGAAASGSSSGSGGSTGASTGDTGQPSTTSNGVSILVNPTIAHLGPSDTVQFTATVSGSSDNAIVWSLADGGGTITASGLYTAPATPATAHIVATAHADAGATTTATAIASVPGNCGALAPVGTWESIHGDWTYALVVDPFDPATVFMGINGKGLLKSTDCGSTWVHINTGVNGASLDQGGLVSISLDPATRGVMYVAPIYGAGGLWKSIDAGVDWTQLLPAGSEGAAIVPTIDSVSMDPTNSQHIVIGAHANCAAPYAPTCEAETVDAGVHWRFFRSPPGTLNAAANWEEGGGPWVINASTWLYGGLHLWLTTNNGADWSLLDPDPAQYYSLNGGEVETHSIPHGSDGSYYITTGQGIVRSTDGGLSWELIPDSGGQSVGFIIGGGKMYTSNEWSATYHVADENDPTHWSDFAPPPDLATDQGAPFIDYDPVHHILYSSNFQGGAWRVVVP